MVQDAKQVPMAGTIEEELLRLLARQARRIPIPVFTATAIIAGIVAPHVPAVAWSLWLALAALVLAVRWFVLGRLPGWTQLSDKRRLLIACLLSAVNGCTHGLSLIFFPDLTGFERAIQSFLLVGLCAGAVATTAGHRPIFLAYLLPTLGALTVMWAALPVPEEHHTWIYDSVALIIALFGLVLVGLARDANRLFRESFEIRLQQSALNRRLSAALEVAEAANRAKTRFLASASHDLRQPVHTLSLFAAALGMRPLDGPSRDIATHIDTALTALAAQLDALLDISKLDAGVIQAAPEAVALDRMLERLRDEYGQAARRNGLTLELACAPGLHVHTDPVLLERVLRNLVGNAVKYTRNGGIRIDAFVQSGTAVLIVGDSGPGIPEAEQARVFEEFYQIDNPERSRGKGLGLGLAIVRRLIDLLAIRMEMVSLPGSGTWFFLMLPPCAARMQAPKDAAAVPALAPWPLHVLVVDDEASIREGMRMLLEGLGARVSLADGSAAATDAARANRPDLVLADLRLRGDDSGIAAVRAVRRLHPGTPALLVSGDTAPDRLQEAEDAGIAMLHKPVPAETLRRAIVQAVQRPRTETVGEQVRAGVSPGDC